MLLNAKLKCQWLYTVIYSKQTWQEQTVIWELLTGMTGADCYVRASYRHDKSRLLYESFIQAWQEQTAMLELLTEMTGADLCESFLQARQEQIVMWKLLTGMTGVDLYESFLQAWQEQIVMWELLTGMAGAYCYVRASYRHDRSRLLCESFL